MAVVSTWTVVSSKDHVHPTVKRLTQKERGAGELLPLKKLCRCFSTSLVGENGRRWNVLLNVSEVFPKANRRQGVVGFCTVHNRHLPLQKSIGMPVLKVYNADNKRICCAGSLSNGEKPCSEPFALGKSSSQSQLKSLDSYFNKLHSDMNEQRSSCASVSQFGNNSDAEGYEMESFLQSEGQRTDATSNQYGTKTGLDSLDNYFAKLNRGSDVEKGTPPTLAEEVSERYPERTSNYAIGEYHEKENVMAESNDYKRLEHLNNEIGEGMFDDESTQGLHSYNEASDFYLINLLVAINIAVFLFGIASPIGNSELEHLSVPLMYGAKINKLILVGEWWRLLTPMFLHSGFLHVTLSCWVLLTFGPQVCRGYGPFTFFLIYILGGLCGNLTSFIHTPELTVCGTGPVFAIIGAWLVFQIQNKQVVAKEASESLFWKAVIATALSFLLSNFGRIDDWTHLGAAFSGIVYGYLTCPTLQLLDNASSSKNGTQKQSIALVQQQADPCKSLGIFTISILVIFAFAALYWSEFEILEQDGFV